MANNSQPPGAQSLWPPPAGSIGSQGFGSGLPPQFRPAVATPQGHGFLPSVSPQFRPVGQAIPASNIGMPGAHVQSHHFPHSVQHVPLGSSQPGYTMPSQALPLPYGQPNRPLSSSAPLPHQGVIFSHQMPGLAAFAPGPSPYSYAAPAFGQQQNNTAAPMQLTSQFQAPAAVQPWPSSATSPAVPVQQGGPEPPSSDIASSVSSQSSSSDWQEHEANNGRRYYYNKKTKQSSWEKPAELMTPIERADASTVWKEFTASDGRKYYYNKVTKQSVWSIPEEMKVARERALQENNEQHTETDRPADGASGSGAVLPEVSSDSAVASSPLGVAPASNLTAVSTASTTPMTSSLVTPSDNGTVSISPPVNANLTSASGSGSPDGLSKHHLNSVDEFSTMDIEEAKKGMASAGQVNVTPVEEKASGDEPLVFSSKQEAKNAFKALLESVNVQSDWTWEQTMKEIINDKRYGALKTLGERKQAFNEYLGQRKKVDAEEKRVKQKKAREEFLRMLEECKELTSSDNWSKAVSMFEKDERFAAVERSRDREDLFDSYMVELERKEKEKAAENRKHYLAEFRKYLESCDFIKVTSQWRKIVDLLGDDERCLRLEKIDKLLVFQDYIHDLLKEEEEQKKLQKEQVRRAERKNRDGFRKLMEEHVATGTLTAKTPWLDYCLKVRDTTEYKAVASNISGSTPKELFEDVYEDLENQYHEDKTHIKDSMKSAKISVESTWTFEDFKVSVSGSIIDKPVSDINLKLIYEELIEKAKEKEEKAAKKRQYLADDFTDLLYSLKEITVTSSWEDCKPLFEDSVEYKSMGDEGFSKEVFEEYIAYLQDKAKEKERKREEEKTKKEKDREDKEKRKEKDRRDKDKDREREKGRDKSRKDDSDSETGEINDAYDYKEEKRRDKDKDRKHRKHHASASDDVYSDRDEKESKRSRKHGSDRKKSKRHGHSPDSDGERYKRHKKESRDDSQRNGHDELEDGEVGEDGEIR
ncbi:hypothetical protein MLD38_024708 [Melastoma candidum]|uniref:Uncharacterized protein n=1 Tax=Melastoma candidum TaxID=119954 RepID=A0ACB9NSU6_9MYRT|nr:hypothetical protein MLD38_024708 [Melastoma candidum]